MKSFKQITPQLVTPADRLQQQLAKHCFWDEVEQELYIDARKLFPKLGVVTILGWDNMVMNALPIPVYPPFFKLMGWANQSYFYDWRKQIPKWVQESCALFPSHQMTLLHYAGKYPQVLELLDHAPMMAWRLVTSGLEEPEVVALLSGKRTQIAATIGWPEKSETVKFLTNLRLRWVNKEIAEQVETCLLDEQRLTALQNLPRINSMALSLAARFPELIGSTLHHALAQLPCRPMQCQSMIALLEDGYRLADDLNLSGEVVDTLGRCRYLVEVTEIYQAWLVQAIDLHELDSQELAKVTECLNNLPETPQPLHNVAGWIALSEKQQHCWLTDEPFTRSKGEQLVAWQDEDGLWGALVSSHVAEEANVTEPAIQHEVCRVRGLENSLPGAKQLSTLHLWQASQFPSE